MSLIHTCTFVRIDKLDEEISMWVDEGHASVCQGGGFFRRSIACNVQTVYNRISNSR